MRSEFSSLVVAALVVAVPLGVVEADARACGPDFPHELLRDRKGTKLELVEGTFDFEAAHLVAPPFRYVVDERFGGEEKPRPPGGPEETALYDEGAAAWRAGDVDVAVASWKKLLALDPTARKTRSTWAAYMLGRATDDPAWFQKTRALVQDGFDDGLALAAASLGEEARVHLAHGDVAGAVQLYAEQAAMGSEKGRTSLLFVARDLVRAADGKDDELRAAMKSPLVQRLVASYLWSRRLEVDDTRMARLLDVAARAPLATPAAERFAAAAYTTGHFDVAGRLLRERAPSPLGLWVLGKLALRSGDVDLGRTLLAEASRAFPADEQWGERRSDDGAWETISPRCRIDGELAVLALERQDYENALALLLTGGDRYWNDAAYVAERVLTVEELVAFVQRRAPRAVPPVKNEWGYEKRSVESRLRALLARRMLREGRFEGALAWFDDANERDAAARFIAARRATSTGDAVSRASAWYDAGRILEEHGMQIVATELDPDWAVYGGSFDLGDWGSYDSDDNFVPSTPRKDAMVPADDVSVADERSRVRDAAPKPFRRFHYRSLAADYAWRAADQLPPRTQAFAAVLCNGSSWVMNRDDDKARALYRRYVREGALVDFGATFGVTCPAPDFDRVLHPPSKSLVERAAEMRRSIRLRDVARDLGALLLVVMLTHVTARTIARRLARPRPSTMP
jgi:hypothetical protein